MMDAIYFGDKINECKEKLRSALIQSGQFYDLLCGDFISLKFIQDLSTPLLELKEEIESNFIELLKINPNDLDLQYLVCIYVQVLDFQNRRISQFQKEAFYNLELAQKQKNYKINCLKQNYFYGKNCVVFSSLLKNTFSINLVSNSFFKIFGIKPDMVVGKQLNILIPKAIKKDHDKMIQNFIDQDSMSIIGKGERNTFALDYNGFVFPISLRIKIEMLTEDVGVCALIKKINNQKDYILFDEKGNITDYSKKIYCELFQTTEKKIDDNQNIFNMILNLQEIIQKKQMYTQFCSVLISVKQDKKFKSQKIQENLIFTSVNNQNNLYSFNDDVFIIKFKVCQKQARINVNMTYLEIESYEKETNQNKKNKIIDELNKQLIQREIHSNLNKPTIRSISTGTFSQLEHQIFDGRISQNLEINNSFLQRNLQEDQKYQKARKWSIFNLNSQSIKGNELNQALNQEQKDEYLTKSFSELPSTYRYYRMQEFYENHADSIDQLNQNGGIYDITSYRSSNINENKQIGIHKMLSNLNNSNNNTINFYTTIDHSLSHHRQKQYLLANDQFDSNQIITANSKLFIDQANNPSDFCINFFQNNQNVIEQKYKDFKINENSNGDNILDRNQLQKIMSESDKSFSIEDNLTNKNKRKMRDFQGKEELIQEQQNEIASVNSSKYSQEDRIKKNMIRRIQQKIFAKSLYIMAFAGFVASITLIIVTIIIYLENINSLDNFIDSFLKIDGTIFCFIDVMKILALSNYQYMLGTTPIIQDSLDLQNQENVQVFFQMNSVIQDYSNNFQQLVLNNTSQEQLDELQNNPFLIQIYPIYFYYSTDVSKYQITSYNQSLQYTIMQYFYQIIFYVYNYTEQQESFIWGNIVQFQSRMKNLQLIVENYVQTQFKNMEEQQMSVIILVGILSFLVVFSIIPLYIYIQIKREKVMKLFGTFQPQILEFQIQLIELAIFKIDRTKMVTELDKKMQPSNKSSKMLQSIYRKDLIEQAVEFHNKVSQKRNNSFKQMDLLPKYIKRLQHSRNRSMASFNNLTKFNMPIIFLGIIAIVLLCIQPALNIFQFNPFQTETRATLQDRITLIDVFTLLIENQASHIEQILCLSINYLPSTTYYYSFLQNITDSNQQKISQLQNLTTNLGIQRYNQNLFDDFYKNILNQDLCQVRQNFPQYFNSNLTQATFFSADYI
ncbi:transmembrane protein, putative (macronuclear) [Tetrahymena thermophila SB210]|uniref:Transmembrane protein, putative n=1 Tax=Tetrahymena thermophila (strain SB210) TaxID=312017 RepID=Q22VC5_TETTS|nr:transmembrane protein, putative [Tetrahymena thermophila SB210]EAR89240.2 transmembrane protein, putative [Tetrahymena thermophila SB210]|eukprot:XP_001009485.2 transmembrane protein, putative [Tetrahymena thermophila SB210]